MALLAKIVLIGDGGVGKTSLRNDYIGKGFGTDYLPTLGSDFVSKAVSFDAENGEETELRFQIWDLAGQPSFKQIRSMYYRRAVGGLLVFDITNEATLHNLKAWTEELVSNSGSPHLSIVVLGNKADLKGAVTNPVSPRKAKRFISSELTRSDFGHIEYIETSAKNSVNVNLAFDTLAKQILKAFQMIP